MRDPQQEVWNLRRRETGLAGKRQRALGIVQRRAVLLEALLEDRAYMVKVGPIPAACRRQAALDRLQPRLRRQRIAVRHQRDGLPVIDLEEVGLQSVAVGTRAGGRDHSSRFAGAAMEVMPE